MVLSIHIGCMQGSKLYLACQPAHKAASLSISKAMYLSTLLWGFFCRKKKKNQRLAGRVTVTGMAIENLQPVAYVVSSIAFAIGTCSIFLRLYCRWRLRIFGWDDFVAVGLLVSWFYNSVHMLTIAVLICIRTVRQCCPAIHSIYIPWLRMWNVSLSCASWERSILTINSHINRLPVDQVSQIQKVGCLSLRATCDIVPWQTHSGYLSRKSTTCLSIGPSSRLFSYFISDFLLAKGSRLLFMASWH